MKQVNIKDVDVSKTEEDTSKSNIKKIILLIIFGIVSLIGVFFWSTKIRWVAEIEDYTEILYYGQEEIKVEQLTGFYGEEIEIKLDEYSAYLMYCDSEYGGTCITGDFNNGFENLLREPSVIINIVILVDLVLLFLLLKDKCFGYIKTYVVFAIVLIYGFILIGQVIVKVADYYTFVNDSKNLANAIVIKGLVTENKNEYYPVITYSTKQGDFTTYIDVSLKGKIEDELPKKDELTVYYDKKDNSICTIKQSLTKYILPLIVGIVYIVMAIVYLGKSKKIEK